MIYSIKVVFKHVNCSPNVVADSLAEEEISRENILLLLFNVFNFRFFYFSCMKWIWYKVLTPPPFLFLL